MNAIQLDFFKSKEESEIDHLRITIEEVKKSSDKVRRGTFAKISEVKKECMDINERLRILERHLCRGDKL